jgi:hypothetical protein
MSLEDHVKKINLAKSRVKNSIFEMAEAITNAVFQLEDRQKDLAEQLGMSRGTLSKWIAIGSNQSLMNMKQSVPESFDSLYQLSSLEKQYNKFYGNREGHKKFLDLFKNNFITPLSQRGDINNVLKLHKDKIKQTTIKTKYLDSKDQQFSKSIKNQSEIKLAVLLKSKLFFNTIVVVPLEEQLNQWRQDEIQGDINSNYAIRNLENKDKNIFQICLIKVKGKDIDIGIKALGSWGYDYNKILVPKQTKNSLVDISSEFIVVVGSKGTDKKENFIMRSSATIDLIEFAKQIGEQPYLFVGEKLNIKNWVYCVG